MSVMRTASEGGAWGIAVLAAYMLWKEEGEALCDYMENKIFADAESTTIEPDAEDVAGFQVFIERYKAGLAIERAAVDNLK